MRLTTLSSRWHLLGAQVEGSGDDGRVWRCVHAARALEQSFGQSTRRDQRPTSIARALTTEKSAVEVEQLEPKDPALIATIKSMNERGIQTLYGRWLIDGAPRVLLFDIGTAWHYLDEWKGDLWSVAGIPSPPNDTETKIVTALATRMADSPCARVQTILL